MGVGAQRSGWITAEQLEGCRAPGGVGVDEAVRRSRRRRRRAAGGAGAAVQARRARAMMRRRLRRRPPPRPPPRQSRRVSPRAPGTGRGAAAGAARACDAGRRRTMMRERRRNKQSYDMCEGRETRSSRNPHPSVTRTMMTESPRREQPASSQVVVSRKRLAAMESTPPGAESCAPPRSAHRMIHEDVRNSACRSGGMPSARRAEQIRTDHRTVSRFAARASLEDDVAQHAPRVAGRGRQRDGAAASVRGAAPGQPRLHGERRDGCAGQRTKAGRRRATRAAAGLRPRVRPAATAARCPRGCASCVAGEGQLRESAAKKQNKKTLTTTRHLSAGDASHSIATMAARWRPEARAAARSCGRSGRARSASIAVRCSAAVGARTGSAGRSSHLRLQANA